MYSTDFKQRPNFHLKPLCTQLHPQHEAMKTLVIPWLWSSFKPIFIPACKLHYRHKHESIWDSGKKKILITLQGANEFFPNHFWVPLPVLLSILQAGTLSYILFQLLLSTLPSTFWVLSHVLCLPYTLPQLLQNDSQVIQLSCILSYLLLSNLLSTSEYSSQILGEITFRLAYSPNCFWVTYPRLSEYSQVM